MGLSATPLAHRHTGNDAIDKVDRRSLHAARGARGAETASATRKRDEHALPAGVAVRAREAVGEDAAREVPLELGDDEAWEASAVGALGDLGEERVPVGANGLVEDRPLRLAAAIGRGERPAGDAGWRS